MAGYREILQFFHNLFGILIPQRSFVWLQQLLFMFAFSGVLFFIFVVVIQMVQVMCVSILDALGIGYVYLPSAHLAVWSPTVTICSAFLARRSWFNFMGHLLVTLAAPPPFYQLG